ncbi:hypothetical protein [Microcella sp.]|uniref:hypothetical protein n=1 Tax=Microcella sp. TaxID=1913979 RepID=UPI00391D7B47
MGFIRVKSKATGHEFDVSPEHAARRAEDWDVIDSVEVERVRPPKHNDTANKTSQAAPAPSEPGKADVATGADVKDDRFSKGSAK